MRFKQSFICLLFSVISVAAVDPEPWNIPAQIEGSWKIYNDSTRAPKAIARLWTRHDTLYGMIESVFDKQPGVISLCSKCPDTLKNKPIEGLRFMWGFVERNGHWVRGRILDPDNGKVYKCELTLSEYNDTLVVFGYINFLVKIGRSEKWVREK